MVPEMSYKMNSHDQWTCDLFIYCGYFRFQVAVYKENKEGKSVGKMLIQITDYAFNSLSGRETLGRIPASHVFSFLVIGRQ